MSGETSLRTADSFPVVASLPRGREATTGNASAVRRLRRNRLWRCFRYEIVTIGQ